ncbi:MAG: ABC transporter permease [Thalassolituus sp.]
MIRLQDHLTFTLRSVTRQRFRTTMQLVAMAIGVLAVVLLTGIGEGGRRFVMAEFASLGNDVLVMLPGRKETTGGLPPLTGEGTRDITLEDAQSLLRISGVKSIAPIVVGTSRLSISGLSRDSLVLGTTQDFFTIRDLNFSQGQAYKTREGSRSRAECTLGATLRDELFGPRRALGEWINVGDYRCRVTGVLTDSGTGFGFDMSNALIVPVDNAMQIFNTEGLFRVMIQIEDTDAVPAMTTAIENQMQMRHDGQLDITIVTPDSLLSAFNNVLMIMTFAVAGIAAISLLVAGVLIMNMTLIGVAQRRAEIGLLKALGASSREVRLLFITEATLLAISGAVLGMLIAEVILMALRIKFPEVPFATPIWASTSAIGLSALAGVLFSWIPAQKAAKLPPVLALQAQAGK